MKEAIRIVLESIYGLEFPDTSHFRSGRGFHSILGRINEEWGTSRWFLEFDIRKCFHSTTDIDSSQSLRKRSTIPSSFTPFRKSFPPDDSYEVRRALTLSHTVSYYRSYQATSTYTSSIRR